MFCWRISSFHYLLQICCNNTKINLATVNLNTLKEGVLYKFAKCCSPVLPDEIIGFITRGNGISIHKKNCKNIMYYIKNNKLDNIISLNWDDIKSNIKTLPEQI